MPRIRSFTKEDIPSVSGLHRRVFGVRNEYGGEDPTDLLQSSYSTWFDEVFLNNPWKDCATPSLVYEYEDGRIAGFLGVVPRRMVFDGSPVNVALSTQFVVEQESRSAGVGIRLLQAFLAGPQDLSLTDEANHPSRRLWEALGGRTALVYSFNWTRMLSPLDYWMTRIGRRAGATALVKPARPLTRLVDGLISKRFPDRFRPDGSDLVEQDLTAELYIELMQSLAGERRLKPACDVAAFNWLTGLLSRNRLLGDLRGVALNTPGGEPVGLYLCFIKPGGESTLVQLIARRKMEGRVLEHLFTDAWKSGSTAVTGRLDPQHSLVISEKHCSFACGAPWTLIHSQNRELIGAIDSGEALLTGMEGEMSIRFIPPDEPASPETHNNCP